MITEFKDNLRNLKTMLKELKKLDKIKRQQILKIDKMVDEMEELKTKNDVLEVHDKNLEFLKLKSRFLKRLNNIEEEIKLRNATRKEIDEINILELELEIKQKLSM